MEHQTLKESGLQFNQERFEKVKNSEFLKREWEIICGMERGIEYYKYIINNVTIQKNDLNSYILWICEKVDDIDFNRPTLFRKGNYSLPDIDVDFPPSYRDKVVEYLKNKYGDSQVCQMLTFGRLAGRSILKEVLRVNESCSFDQMNKITEKIPNEAAISDLLEEMDNPSVIRWALENDRNSLIDYCWLDDDDTLQGEYAKVFEQAMRMEGIFKTQGKHAAGVVIASDDLTKICPMVKSSRSSEQIAGMEMGDLEAIGCVKFDILGVSLLEKLSNTVEEINYELS